MPICLARYTTPNDKLYFGDGKHRFYMERCCGATCEGTVCGKCSVKNQIKVQDCRTFDHGFMGGAYPAKSQMFDSPYYHAGVLKFGAPSETDLERAMEAKRKAQGGAVAPVSAPVAVAPTPIPEQKKPRGRPKSSAKALAQAAPEEKPKKEVQPKKDPKPKAKDSKKTEVVVAKPQEAAVVHTLPQEGMVETMDDPLIVRDVIRILLKPFTHGSTKYWRDSDREKLYSCTKDGKRGGYVGRWDSVNTCIVKDAYDSDEDN